MPQNSSFLASLKNLIGIDTKEDADVESLVQKLKDRQEEAILKLKIADDEKTKSDLQDLIQAIDKQIEKCLSLKDSAS
ncbi:MAG: hypothetical protein ACK5LP_06115 [Campylobacteraceae bacterium]